MSTEYSIGQMNQLADALEKAGYSREHVATMRNNIDLLKEFKGVLAGELEIGQRRHIFNLDVHPTVPDTPEGSRVLKHRRGPSYFEWNPAKVKLIVSKAQSAYQCLGKSIYKELKQKPVFSACLLDCLLAHPELVPETWKREHIYFWGTIFCSGSGSQYVRFLEGGVHAKFHYLDGAYFSRTDVAAVSAESAPF